MLKDLTSLILLIYIKIIVLENKENKFNLIFYLIFNFIINSFLKIIINQDRPINHKTNYGLLQSKGMPSGHAQLSFFTYFYLYDDKNKSLNNILLILALVISYERIYNNKHSFLQVLIGGLIGSYLGVNLKNEIIKF